MRLLLVASAFMIGLPHPLLADSIAVTGSVNSQSVPDSGPSSFCSQAQSIQAVASVSFSLSCPAANVSGTFSPPGGTMVVGTASYTPVAATEVNAARLSAATPGPATNISGGIYVSHNGFIPLASFGSSGGGSISIALSEMYIFAAPTTVSIDLLELVGGDGPHAGITRNCSYVFDGNAFTCPQLFGQTQVDNMQSFFVNPGIQYPFTLDASIDYATGAGVESSSGAITYDVSAANGQVAVAPVPEPASLLLLGTGLLTLLALKKHA